MLKCFEQSNLLASMPTRKDFIPEKDLIDEGCIELPEINQNCFLPATKIVTENNKAFDFNTFLYGHQIDDYSEAYLKEIYPLENIDFQRWGTMKADIFRDLVECFKNSKSVKRKYKRLLEKKA